MEAPWEGVCLHQHVAVTSQVCDRRTVNAPIPQQLVLSFSLLSQEKSAEIILYRESVEWEG